MKKTLSKELDQKIKNAKSKKVNKSIKNTIQSDEKIFTNEEERVAYYKFQDTKSRGEYLDEKYGLEKDNLKIIIDNPALKEYIKQQSVLNECSHSEYVTQILTFEKEENEFVLNEVSEELEALKDGTFDYSTLSSADELLEYLEKTHPSNILGDYAKKHNYGWYEALHEMVNEHKEMKLLIQYDNEELTIGQVAEQLCISKSEVLDLLQKHKIPYVRVDEEYLEQEFNSFKKVEFMEEIEKFKIKYEEDKNQMVNETLEISLGDMESLEVLAKDKNMSVGCLVSFVLHNVAQDKKGKWSEFTEKMDGLFTPDIINHIKKTSKELRGK